MALQQRKITLNSISGGETFRSGSTFLVEYSLDCVNYYTTSLDLITLQSAGGTYPSPYTASLLDWNRITLPNVGATGYALIPTGSTCMRLTDVYFPTLQYVQIL